VVVGVTRRGGGQGGSCGGMDKKFDTGSISSLQSGDSGSSIASSSVINGGDGGAGGGVGRRGGGGHHAQSNAASPEGGPSTPSGAIGSSGGSPYDINGTNFNPDFFIKKIIKVSLQHQCCLVKLSDRFCVLISLLFVCVGIFVK